MTPRSWAARSARAISAGDAEGAGRIEGPLLVEHLVDGAPLEQLHDHEAGAVRVVEVPVVVDHHDVRVGELRERGGLEQESLLELGVRLAVAERRVQNLQRDPSSERLLLGDVDRPHPAAAEDRLDAVLPADDLAHERVRASHPPRAVFRLARHRRDSIRTGPARG